MNTEIEKIDYSHTSGYSLEDIQKILSESNPRFTSKPNVLVTSDGTEIPFLDYPSRITDSGVDRNKILVISGGARSVGRADYLRKMIDLLKDDYNLVIKVNAEDSVEVSKKMLSDEVEIFKQNYDLEYNAKVKHLEDNDLEYGYRKYRALPIKSTLTAKAIKKRRKENKIKRNQKRK